MRRIFFLSVICILLSLLSACSPTKQYRYIPPQSASDQLCTQQCSVGRRSCEKICKLKHPACFARVEAFTGRPAARTSSCYSPCNCTITYHRCYRACGGQVIDTGF